MSAEARLKELGIVLPSLPKTDTIPNTVKKLKPFLGSRSRG